MSYDAAHRLQLVTYGYTANASYRPPFLAEMKAGDNKPIPAAYANARVMSQSFKNDAQGNVRSSDDDEHLPFDRSLGTAYVGIGADGVPRGPNQFLDAEGIHAAYDIAGNLTELTVERAACTADEPQCSMRFVYDWDEVGHMLRARRYDYTAGPVPAFDGAATPTWELGYAYSEDIRVRISASSEGAEPTHTLYVFDTHRVENTVFDVDAGYQLQDT